MHSSLPGLRFASRSGWCVCVSIRAITPRPVQVPSLSHILLSTRRSKHIPTRHTTSQTLVTDRLPSNEPAEDKPPLVWQAQPHASRVLLSNRTLPLTLPRVTRWSILPPSPAPAPWSPPLFARCLWWLWSGLRDSTEAVETSCRSYAHTHTHQKTHKHTHIHTHTHIDTPLFRKPSRPLPQTILPCVLHSLHTQPPIADRRAIACASRTFGRCFPQAGWLPAASSLKERNQTQPSPLIPVAQCRTEALLHIRSPAPAPSGFISVLEEEESKAARSSEERGSKRFVAEETSPLEEPSIIAKDG